MYIKNCIEYIKKNKVILSLLLILILGAVLRFLGAPLRYGFDIDATRDAILTQYATMHNLWPLIGPISALGSFNFGPWYYYQLIIFQHFVPFAYSPWVYITLTSLTTILVMYGVGQELFGKPFGLILALLAAFSPGQIIAGTGLSNPDLISLFAALSIWLFIRIQNTKYQSLTALLLGLSIGIGINCHYQMIYFVFLPFLLPFIVKKGRPQILLFSLLGIFITFIPLIIFNLTHHFQTVSGLIDYYIYGKNKVYVPNSWKLYLFNFWPEFWGYVFGFSALGGFLLMVGSLLTSAILIFKRKSLDTYSVLFGFFILSFILLRFFSGERTNYYLIFFHPFLILLTGVFIWQSIKVRFGKLILVLVLIGITAVGLKVDLVHTHIASSHTEALETKRVLSSRFPNQKFSIYACKGQYKDRVQAIVFLMNNEKLLDGSVKIGFRDEHCSIPVDDSMLNSIGVINLTAYSKEKLSSYGWTLISPEYLYQTLLGSK
jgi:4-amino-4-deoxy-L-arabinose transferase-like glycosyltransferase